MNYLFKSFPARKLIRFLCLIGFLITTTNVFAQSYPVTLQEENTTQGKVIDVLKKQTNLDFFYSNQEVDVNKAVTVSFNNIPVVEALHSMLGEGFNARIQGNRIIISQKTPSAQNQKPVVVKGTVKDSGNLPLPGVSIRLKDYPTLGATTDGGGNYTLSFPSYIKATLLYTFIGMKPVEVVYNGQAEINVTMEDDVTMMDAVVVTGIFERSVETFTGSVSTYNTEEIKAVGAQNVLQSLRTLDPSFQITPSNEFGSDPNRLPDINIQGKTSIVSFEEEYATDPNQPLFVLDGFEVSLQTIVDLNMNRVASITLLKDAASTALYGSRAANGVVVVETVRPKSGELKVNYNGDFSVSMPDLSDYNMMNAAEKLEFEKLARYYNARAESNYYEQFGWTKLYNERLARIQSGVDSYWLNEPVRTGFTHKHNLYIYGGDDAMTYGLGVNYGGTSGVMKESGRDIVGMNVDLNYRKGKFRFTNKFNFDYTDAYNPPTPFSVFVQTNPYYEKEYEGSTPPRWLDYQNIYITQDTASSSLYSIRQGNPLYNNSLNHLNTTKTTTFRNNFQAEWRPQDGLSIKGRISLLKSDVKTEIFKSPYHTDYEDKIKTERGSYKKNTSDVFKYDGDVIITYGKVFGEKHLVNAVGGWNFMSTKSIYDGFEVIGFPDDIIPNPAFANQYPENKKASYNENIARSTSFYLNANYGYDNRYLMDLSYRKDGSSVFGTNKRFTDTWAIGLAWNIHNEAFMGDWASFFKLRGSVGNPGNQNFAAYNSYTSYVYNTNAQNLFGIGANIAAFGNPDLKWQKTMQYNIGADVALFNEKLRLTTDVFRKITDPLIIYIDIEPSTGRTQFVTNLGIQKTQGISFTAVYYPIYRPSDRFTWSVSFMGQHRKEKYDKIGNKLESLNNKHKDNSSFQRFYDGSSVNSIWAVRSAGIDPMSGQEIFIKKDGSYTFDYNAEDIIKVGNALEKLGGTIGTNVFYKGFSLGVFLRYTWGADYFNKELYERIERIDKDAVAKYNQDKRALYDRWKNPGDIAKYRSITALQGNDKDKMSDRYVQRQHTITGESISVGYDFRNQTWIKKLLLEDLAVRAIMNDIFRISTIKAERGISYPFARTVSLSLNASF